MKELNNKLDGLNELITRIDSKILDINTKLDELIKALHDYDGENIEDVNEGYGESSFEAFKLTNDYISSLNIEETERRMDIIGQNGNEGLHYDSHHVTNEEADDDARSNNSDKRTGVDKKRNKRKYYKPKQQ
jgi:hypothetical protein